MIRRVCIFLVMLLLGGCSNPENNDKKLSIVCSAFPQYDWVRQILGDEAKNTELILLTENGGDLHSYQPSATDIAKISTADIFIYTGGQSDSWTEKIIKSSENPVAVNMLEESGVCEAHGHEHEECDEHVWLSLRCSMELIGKISGAICAADSVNAEKYKENTEKYIEELKRLDTEYEEAVKTAKRKEIVFCDRFPFSYLAEDYGIRCYTAFDGCSADSEVSFETVISLAKKLDETGISAVLTIENSDNKIAEAVIGNTEMKNQEIMVMKSCQSGTSESYITTMMENLEVLKKVLN